jgi:ribonuclease J
MIEMVRPRAFIPLHGTLHHLTRHAALARDLGVPSVCVLEDGDTALLDAGGVKRDARVEYGRVHVFARRAIPQSVLRQRMVLAAEGAALVVVRLDAAGALAGEVIIATRGVLDEERDAHLLAVARNEARASILDLSIASRTDEAVAEAARLAVRRAFSKSLGFKPVTVVSVQRG